MKTGSSNYLETYANIVVYVLIIMAAVVGNIMWGWSYSTITTIIFLMCLLIIFDIFKQALLDPFKGKKIRKILLITVVAAAIIGIIMFYLRGWRFF